MLLYNNKYSESADFILYLEITTLHPLFTFIFLTEFLHLIETRLLFAHSLGVS